MLDKPDHHSPSSIQEKLFSKLLSDVNDVTMLKRLGVIVIFARLLLYKRIETLQDMQLHENNQFWSGDCYSTLSHHSSIDDFLALYVKSSIRYQSKTSRWRVYV